MIDLMAVVFILVAWFAEMPLWLSILLTVLFGVRAIIVLAVRIYKLITKKEFSLFNF